MIDINREKFEAWAKSQGLSVTRGMEEYGGRYRFVEHHWIGWQAARAQPDHVNAAVEMVERVALSDDDIYATWKSCTIVPNYHAGYSLRDHVIGFARAIMSAQSTDAENVALTDAQILEIVRSVIPYAQGGDPMRAIGRASHSYITIVRAAIAAQADTVAQSTDAENVSKNAGEMNRSKCDGCNGNGEIGGLRQDGYHSEECPFCGGSGSYQLPPLTQYLIAEATRDDDEWSRAEQIRRLSAELAGRDKVIDRLLAALQVAQPYVASMNCSEGMLEGFGGRKPRPSDADLELIDETIAAFKMEI